MKNLAYCSMIHGGLNLRIKNNDIYISNCCLRPAGTPSLTEVLSESHSEIIHDNDDIWNNTKLVELRDFNKTGQWDATCRKVCKGIEKSGAHSFRTGMNSGLGTGDQTELSGPTRIDLTFDISCNLACRICGSHSSTFWQKHLKDNGEWNKSIYAPKDKDRIISLLKGLDLSNLQMVVFCGGETLMGNGYWGVTEWLADNVPNAKEQLTVCFQTNGTQPISQKYYNLIEKFKLAKMHISIDGVKDRFEYLRWPASWNQVTDNILTIRKECPCNVMFLVEETISIHNVLYMDEVSNWMNKNFSHNRLGDAVDHTRHLAFDTFSLSNCTQELVDEVKKTSYGSIIPADWYEDIDAINKTVAEIKKVDQWRNQSFVNTFPEVAECYSRYF